MTVKKGNIDFSKVITQEMRDAEAAKQRESDVRAERDRLLDEVLWMRDRHQDEKQLAELDTPPGGTASYDSLSLSPYAYIELVQYIQALRDVPQQPGFPENVEWPDKPLFLQST